MDFKEAFTLVNDLAQAMPAIFDRVTIELAFGDASPAISGWSNPANSGMLVTGDGVGCKSGVYFLVPLKGKSSISVRQPGTTCTIGSGTMLRRPASEKTVGEPIPTIGSQGLRTTKIQSLTFKTVKHGLQSLRSLTRWCYLSLRSICRRPT